MQQPQPPDYVQTYQAKGGSLEGLVRRLNERLNDNTRFEFVASSKCFTRTGDNRGMKIKLDNSNDGVVYTCNAIISIDLYDAHNLLKSSFNESLKQWPRSWLKPEIAKQQLDNQARDLGISVDNKKDPDLKTEVFNKLKIDNMEDEWLDCISLIGFALKKLWTREIHNGKPLWQNELDLWTRLDGQLHFLSRVGENNDGVISTRDVVNVPLNVWSKTIVYALRYLLVETSFNSTVDEKGKRKLKLLALNRVDHNNQFFVGPFECIRLKKGEHRSIAHPFELRSWTVSEEERILENISFHMLIPILIMIRGVTTTDDDYKNKYQGFPTWVNNNLAKLSDRKLKIDNNILTHNWYGTVDVTETANLVNAAFKFPLLLAGSIQQQLNTLKSQLQASSTARYATALEELQVHALLADPEGQVKALKASLKEREVVESIKQHVDTKIKDALRHIQHMVPSIKEDMLKKMKTIEDVKRLFRANNVDEYNASIAAITCVVAETPTPSLSFGNLGDLAAKVPAEYKLAVLWYIEGKRVAAEDVVVEGGGKKKLARKKTRRSTVKRTKIKIKRSARRIR